MSRVKPFTRVRRMIQRCFGLSLYRIRFVYSSGSISLCGGFVFRNRIPRIKSIFGL